LIFAGEESSKVFRRAPFISYIYGSVEKSDMEVEDVPQKERARRSTVSHCDQLSLVFK